MKLAIVTEGEMVSPHFGRSEGMLVVEIADGAMVASERLAAPDHDCSALPRMMRAHGVEVAIVGGLGAGAMQHLAMAGIQVIAGVSGTASEALESYLAGTLVPGEATCGGHGDSGCHGHGPGGHQHHGGHAGPCGH